jgi:hypothetical protein
MARWVRHYRKRVSSAAPIIKRMARREEMANKVSKPKIQKNECIKEAHVREIPAEKYFVLHSGATIRSVEELAHMMDSIPDSDFSFHVNSEKNDFANWIRDVFGRAELADTILPIKDKKESQIVLLKHVAASKSGA